MATLRDALGDANRRVAEAESSAKANAERAAIAESLAERAANALARRAEEASTIRRERDAAEEVAVSWRVECDANVRAAERVAGRCVEKAERFDETRSAFATVLGALDAAVAGAFSRAVAGEGHASLVPALDALRPVALAPPRGTNPRLRRGPERGRGGIATR